MQEIDDGYLRIIDANLNRLREGIRVIEDVCRYIFNDLEASKKLKNLRHSARTSLFDECLNARDSEHDCLRPTTQEESARDSAKTLLIANFKRAQEAARVLEETIKLFNPIEAEMFKSIRYELYLMEKTVITQRFG
jgi:thiamine-phosphate pyrophosphorylase